MKGLFQPGKAAEPAGSQAGPAGAAEPAALPAAVPSYTGKTILSVIPGSRSEGLAGGLMSLAGICRESGYELIAIDVREDGWLEKLGGLLSHPENICCAYTPMGLAEDVGMETPAGSRPLWKHLGIPYIGGYGDHPAYYWERHQSRGPGYASLYVFEEHLEAARDWVQPQRPAGIMPMFVRDPVPRETLDFAAKRSGKLFFFKNGNDPKALLEFWRSLPRPVSGWLQEIAHGIDIFQVGRGLPPLHRLVRQYLADRHILSGPPSQLEIFLVAQLDDYARRMKSTLMAQALLDFPVQVFGDNWGHVDFTGKRASHHEGRSYFDTAQLISGALCVLDMSPNTESLPHERFAVACGQHTLCVSNTQRYYEQNYEDAAHMQFDFTADSLRARIADVLDRPQYYVDLGAAVAQRAAALHPPAKVIANLVDWANLTRFTAVSQPFAGQQNFVVWPPEKK